MLVKALIDIIIFSSSLHHANAIAYVSVSFFLLAIVVVV